MADDIELARLIARGDAAAFRVLVDREARYLYGIAHALAGNAAEAEDLVQETFVAVLAGRFRGESSLRTWLVQILVRRAGMLRRSAWRRRVRTSLDGGQTDHPATEVATPSQTLGTEARLDLATMLECLSPEHRAVIVLREVEGLTYEEMAEALGVPRGTIESRLHRAREAMRKRFRGYLQ
ncbi:MAG: sigma-70 family RNA polymerase sigma factor [Planctomycetes bacterium]|nr:sigma-70 family RNA polymerase sigma factor [Planctomycetota bacterium]